MKCIIQINNRMITNAFILSAILLSYTCSDTAINKSKLTGYDYRLFENIRTWKLAKAVKSGDTAKIGVLVAANKSLISDREPIYGKTLLIMAVKNRNYNSVKKLLELGADPNLQDIFDGNSAFMSSVSIRIQRDTGFAADSRFLNILLKHGGNPNDIQKGDPTKGNRTHFTVLQLACLSGITEYVKILLKAGAVVNLNGGDGVNPLFYAVVSRNPDIVLLLLNSGANFKDPIFPERKGKKWSLSETIDRMWSFDSMSEDKKKESEIKKWIKAHNNW
jgi:ankyrin repeat protein